MKMRELIDRVSDLYRNEREKQKSLSQELYEVHARLWDAENDDFENIFNHGWGNEYEYLLPVAAAPDFEISDDLSVLFE